MITGAINLGLLTLLFFFLGMYKPNWPLFFMKEPNRFIILAVTTILFMVTATLYGEGIRREKLEKAAKQPISERVAPALVPVPVPVPAPFPAKTVTK
ncbi:MAG: hypothetical protein WCH01_03580 [Methylococcaceae bacterium]